MITFPGSHSIVHVLTYKRKCQICRFNLTPVNTMILLTDIGRRGYVSVAVI